MYIVETRGGLVEHRLAKRSVPIIVNIRAKPLRAIGQRSENPKSAIAIERRPTPKIALSAEFLAIEVSVIGCDR